MTSRSPSGSSTVGRHGAGPSEGDPRFLRDHDGPPPPGYVPGRRIVVVFAAVLVAVFALNLWAAFQNRSESRRDEQAELLVDDPTRVTHTWTPTPDGLVEEAVTRTGDADDVALIRRHFRVLREQRANVGSFGTRAFKHRSLPGRDQLEKLVPQMTIESSPVEGGARLVFTTRSEEARQQLAVWGTALTDERRSRS